MDRSRRTVLQMLVVAAVAPLAVQLDSTAAHAATNTPSRNPASLTTLVDRGTGLAVVVVADDADDLTRQAASDLIRVIGVATGVQLPLATVSTASAHGSAIRVNVGPTPANTEAPLVKSLDTEGFVIHVWKDAVNIVGASSAATVLGVTAFLERYLDASWLMPTDLGEEIPATDSLALPREVYKTSPDFLSRQISPFFLWKTGAQSAQYAWASRLGVLSARVDFHHNMYAIISPAVFGKTNPEFFPLRGGVPAIPSNTAQTAWQPRYHAPGIAEAAANRIIAVLTPQSTTYSLGVNDSSGYSEDEIDPTKLNSFGFASASEPYYRFVNEVAQRVTAVYPNVKFGLLAYANVADPPSFPLHPNVVPYLTRDRASWVDPAVRQRDMDWTAAWAACATEVGWYDYPYGSPYCVPRVPMGALADSMKYARGAGVKHFYAELYPNWGEGPKPWVYSKLLWDTNAKAEDLTKEWCRRAVGATAADDLKAYYDLWEDFWTTRIPSTDWFGVSRIYQQFNDGSYLQATTQDDLSRSRTLLESAKTKADPGKHTDRADMLLKAFGYYEDSALSFPRPPRDITGSTDALAVLDEAVGQVEDRLTRATRRLQLVDQFKTDPLLFQPSDPRSWSLIWSGWNFYPLWRLAEYVAANEPQSGPVRDKIAQLLAANPSVNQAKFLQYLAKAINTGLITSGTNMSFEGTTAPWTGVSTGAISSSIPAHEGTSSLQLPFGYNGLLAQTVSVTPGPFRFTAWFQGSTTTPLSGYNGYTVCQFYDANNKVVKQYRAPRAALKNAIGSWRQAELTEMVPDGATKVALWIVVETDGVVYVDDAKFTQISL